MTLLIVELHSLPLTQCWQCWLCARSLPLCWGALSLALGYNKCQIGLLITPTPELWLLFYDCCWPVFTTTYSAPKLATTGH